MICSGLVLDHFRWTFHGHYRDYCIDYRSLSQVTATYLKIKEPWSNGCPILNELRWIDKNRKMPGYPTPMVMQQSSYWKVRELLAIESCHKHRNVLKVVLSNPLLLWFSHVIIHHRTDDICVITCLYIILSSIDSTCYMQLIYSLLPCWNIQCWRKCQLLNVF